MNACWRRFQIKNIQRHIRFTFIRYLIYIYETCFSTKNEKLLFDPQTIFTHDFPFTLQDGPTCSYLSENLIPQD